jgi:DNA repair protein RadC
MPKIKDLPKFARPREKLLEKGPEALSDSELLAILLRTGIKDCDVLSLVERRFCENIKKKG